jgi:hypothetical protein
MGAGPGFCCFAACAGTLEEMPKPSSAKRTPTVQSTKAKMTRGLKNADREVEFSFMIIIIPCVMFYCYFPCVEANVIGTRTEMSRFFLLHFSNVSRAMRQTGTRGTPTPIAANQLG